MKKLSFVKVNNLAQITDELFAAFPEWRKTDAKGITYTEVSVYGDGSMVVMIVPDSADETAIQNVVDAHVPAMVVAKIDPYEQLRTDLSKAALPSDIVSALNVWLTGLGY